MSKARAYTPRAGATVISQRTSETPEQASTSTLSRPHARRAFVHTAAIAVSVGLLAGCADRCGSAEPSAGDKARQEAVAKGGNALNLLRLVSLENHRNATVQMRSENNGQALEQTTGACPATHIGLGWFVTAKHCFTVMADRADSPGIVDITADEHQYGLWQNTDGNPRRVAGVSKIVLDTKPHAPDLALVYAADGQNIHSVTVGNRTLGSSLGSGPDYTTDRFDVTSYSQTALSAVQQVPYTYRNTARFVMSKTPEAPVEDLYTFRRQEPDGTPSTAACPSAATLLDRETGDLLAVVKQQTAAGSEANPGECYGQPITAKLVEQYKL